MLQYDVRILGELVVKFDPRKTVRYGVQIDLACVIHLMRER